MAKPFLITMPNMQFFDNSGLPLNGGSITIYQPGTTTLQNTYPTANNANLGTNPNPNPITLSSSGRPQNSGNPIDLYSTSAYKMVVKDSNGNQIWVEDNITSLAQTIVPVSKTNNYIVVGSDRDAFFECDTSSAGFTLTLLPAATAGAGFRIQVKKISTDANTLTIQANASENIDGSNTLTGIVPYSYIALVCDGTQWFTEKTLQISTIKTVSTTYSSTYADRDAIIEANTTSAGFTITLPLISSVAPGFQVNIIKTSSDSNTLTISGNGVNINGSATTTMSTQYSSIRICSDGTQWYILYLYAPLAPVTSFSTVNVQTFSSSGTYTPTANMKYCIIECIGGGAGGGGTANSTASQQQGGGAGGSGSYSKKYASAATVGASQTVTVGAAANGGAAGNNNGTAGNDTSVGVICVAKGGSAGAGTPNGSSGTGGAGGVAGTGDITLVGNAGEGASYYSVTTSRMSVAVGGVGPLGGGYPLRSYLVAAAINGANGGNYGAGGNGGASVNAAGTASGGNGAQGFVLITEFI